MNAREARALLGGTGVSALVGIRDRAFLGILVSTLALEKEVNTLFRLHSLTVRARLCEAFPKLPEELDRKTVFLKLQERRNAW